MMIKSMVVKKSGVNANKVLTLLIQIFSDTAFIKLAYSSAGRTNTYSANAMKINYK